LFICEKSSTFVLKLQIVMNIFGDKWTFTSFGESHGAAIGGVLDGVPAGLHIDLQMIRTELERRAGKGQLGTSPRAAREPDEVEWLSGVIRSVSPEDGLSAERSVSETVCQQGDLITLGTPIAFLIRNKDARPEDYEWLKHSYRVGHADRVYEQKYGIRDWRGGGRSSARETAARVVAGSLAKQELATKGVSIHAHLVQVGAETDPSKFADVIAAYQREGDSIGGIVECRITGLPVGTGEPIFDKLQAHLAYAVMSINACKGFEYGTGFGGVTQPGSAINHISGGIAGGISDGTEVVFRCVFKPTASTPKALTQLQNDKMVNQSDQPITVGRHDACVATRAVPVVEAMTALAIINLID
jgi:chorismate synthase